MLSAFGIRSSLKKIKASNQPCALITTVESAASGAVAVITQVNWFTFSADLYADLSLDDYLSTTTLPFSSVAEILTNPIETARFNLNRQLYPLSVHEVDEDCYDEGI